MTNARIGTLADRGQTARTAPRFALRTFWLLHRALYRFSGGRIGLSRPEAGARFGMMRLELRAIIPAMTPAEFLETLPDR